MSRDGLQEDGEAPSRYAEEKELVIRSLVRQIRYYAKESAEFDAKLRVMLEQIDFHLHTMTGVDVVTSAELVAEIGDVSRFAGIARFSPVRAVGAATTRANKATAACTVSSWR